MIVQRLSVVLLIIVHKFLLLILRVTNQVLFLLLYGLVSLESGTVFADVQRSLNNELVPPLYGNYCRVEYHVA